MDQHQEDPKKPQDEETRGPADSTADGTLSLEEPAESPQDASSPTEASPGAAAEPEPSQRSEADHEAGLRLGFLKSVARKGDARSSDDPFWISKYIYRRFTIYPTFLSVRLGLTANQVTLISGIAIFLAAICYGLAWPGFWVIGAVLVQVYFILDHVDGEVARYEREVLKRSSGMSGLFFDSCCHAGWLAVILAMAMRLNVRLGDPWWMVWIGVIALFPGTIAPWQRYGEAIVQYAKGHIEDGKGTIPAEFLGQKSLAAAMPGQQRRPLHRRLLGGTLQLIGFPGIFLTILIFTLLDVLPVPRITVNDFEIPYLLIWFVYTSIHRAAASLKSTLVYGNRLRDLK